MIHVCGGPLSVRVEDPVEVCPWCKSSLFIYSLLGAAKLGSLSSMTTSSAGMIFSRNIAPPVIRTASACTHFKGFTAQSHPLGDIYRAKELFPYYNVINPSASDLHIANLGICYRPRIARPLGCLRSNESLEIVLCCCLIEST